MTAVRPATLVLLLGLALAFPAGALAAVAPPAVADPASSLVADPLALADGARALAASLPQGAGLSEQLALLAAPGAPAIALPEATFEEALASVYAQAGVAMPASYAAPEPALAASLAPVLAAIAESARLTKAAFADLDAEEHAFLFANLDALLAPIPGAEMDARADRVQGLAQRVDMPLLTQGALLVALALDEFEAPVVPKTWVDPQGMIEVGGTGSDAYSTARVLIVDLGGNDDYRGRPGTHHPAFGLPLPVSVVLDLGGNDQYSTGGIDPASATTAWSQGVGIGGVGMIVDRWGDDAYIASLYDANGDCAMDWMEGSAQVLYAQGVGALGVGAILDASGNDRYFASNHNAIQSYCHFGWVYTFAQGVGLSLGVGLLVDDTGDESYYAYSYAFGKADNTAAVYSQAAAAGGLGALLDKEGDDDYYANALGQMTFNYVKGAFAYVFSQASVTASRRQPATAPTGPIGFPVALGPCAEARYEAGTRCDGPGAALLLDALGSDSFRAEAVADDYGAGCGWGAIAVTSSQGSAAWTGVAALLNLDLDGADTFWNAPSAAAGACYVLGIRAMAYGHGYGGPIYWNFWDSPSAAADNVAVGILVSAGAPEACRGPVVVGDPQVPKPLQPYVDGDTSVLPGDLCTVVDRLSAPTAGASPDRYFSSATATQNAGGCSSDGCLANAESWAQGSSGTLTDPVVGMSYRAAGVGVFIDIGGDDTHWSTASANGPRVESFVVGQGGTMGGVAVLGNVGGDDEYEARAYENGVDDLPSTRVQGWAEGGTTLNLGGGCIYVVVGTFCPNPMGLSGETSAAVFIEAFGWDRYSEAPERFGCHDNGTMLGTWPIGAPLGPVWWGTIHGSPCPSPTPDVGTGLVLAVDWLSDGGF